MECGKMGGEREEKVEEGRWEGEEREEQSKERRREGGRKEEGRKRGRRENREIGREMRERYRKHAVTSHLTLGYVTYTVVY